MIRLAPFLPPICLVLIGLCAPPVPADVSSLLASCSADCASDLFSTCEDNVCQAHENVSNCPVDCQPVLSEPDLIPDVAFVDAAGELQQLRMAGPACERRGPREWACEHAAASTVLRDEGDGVWTLTFTAREAIGNVRFPWLPEQHFLGTERTDDYVLTSRLGGVFRRAAPFERRKWQWQDGQLIYPAQRFAPLIVLADRREALLVAAANWPPRRVQIADAGYQIRVDYNDGVAAGATLELGAIVKTFRGGTDEGYSPWQLAVLHYRDWLAEAAGPVTHPEWMWAGEGMLSVMLMSWPEFDVDRLSSLWEQWKEHLTWLQCWGQMSNFAGGAGRRERSVPPLQPGEATGCCLVEPKMHRRYLDDFQGPQNGLPALAKRIRAQGYHVGYYTRRDPALAGGYWDADANMRWLQAWVGQNEAAYNANAHYLDEVGRGAYTADVVRAIERFSQDLPDDLVIEGYVDVFPAAPLLSGYIHGGSLPGGPGVAPWSDANTGTFINMSRLLMGDRLGYLGVANGEYRFYGDRAGHWLERQIFLLGTKMQISQPNRVPDDPTSANPYLLNIIRLHQSTQWWQRRPVYLDTLGLSEVPPAMDARRFRTRDGAHLIAIDNPDRLADRTLRFKGRSFAIPAASLSVLEVLADGRYRMHTAAP